MTGVGLRNLTNAFYDLDSVRFDITDEATHLITDNGAARRFLEVVKLSEMREDEYRWTTPAHDVIKMLNDGVPSDWVLEVCTKKV